MSTNTCSPRPSATGEGGTSAAADMVDGRQVLHPSPSMWPNAGGVREWSTVQDLIDKLESMNLQPPIPREVYAQWQQAAATARQHVPSGTVGERVDRGLLCHGPANMHMSPLSGPALANVHGDSLKHVEARPSRSRPCLRVPQDRLATSYKSTPRGGAWMLFPEVGTPHRVRGGAWACPGVYMTDNEVNEVNSEWRRVTGAQWMAKSAHGIHVVNALVFKCLFPGEGVYVTGTEHCQTYCTGLVLGDPVAGDGNTRGGMTASVMVRREDAGAGPGVGKRGASEGQEAHAPAYVGYADLTFLQQQYRIGFQWFVKVTMRDAVAAYLERDPDFIDSMVSGAGPGNPVEALGVDLPRLPEFGVHVLASPAKTPEDEKSLAKMVTAIFEQCYQGPAHAHPHPKALRAYKAWLDFLWTGPTFESAMLRVGARC